MAIIAYWSKDQKQTGQTMGMATIVTYMAMKHNCKILAVGTGFKDRSLEKCFWDLEEKKAYKETVQRQIQVGLTSGVEELMRTINSNKLTPETISNYAKIVFKNKRLDVLLAPKTGVHEEYINMLPNYIEILNKANRFYDFVFVDINRDVPEDIAMKILDIADVVNINVKQSMESINNVVDLKTDRPEFFTEKNAIITIENCDMMSKYNKKNISRYLKEKNMISIIPHNTLLFEACDESKIAQFLLGMKMTNGSSDRNSVFLQEVDSLVEEILFKSNK